MEKTDEVFIPTKWRARISKDNVIELKFFVQNNMFFLIAPEVIRKEVRSPASDIQIILWMIFSER